MFRTFVVWGDGDFPHSSQANRRALYCATASVGAPVSIFFRGFTAQPGRAAVRPTLAHALRPQPLPLDVAVRPALSGDALRPLPQPLVPAAADRLPADDQGLGLGRRRVGFAACAAASRPPRSRHRASRVPAPAPPSVAGGRTPAAWTAARARDGGGGSGGGGGGGAEGRGGGQGAAAAPQQPAAATAAAQPPPGLAPRRRAAPAGPRNQRNSRSLRCV